MGDTQPTYAQLLIEVAELRARVHVMEDAGAWSSRSGMYLATLAETAQWLLTRRDTDELLDSVISHACHLLRTQHGFFATRQADGLLTIRAARGALEPYVGRAVEAEGVTQEAMRTGVVAAVDHYDKWEKRSLRPELGEVRSAMAVPLNAGDFVEGALTLFRGEPDRPFSDDDQALVAGFAQLAAIALDNARLFGTLQAELAQKDDAEKALRESESRLRALFESLPDATFAIDRRGNIIAWNKAMEDLTGVPAASMIGKGDYAYAIPFYGIRRPVLIDLPLRREDDVEARYENLIEKNGVFTAEVYFPRMRPGGVYLWGRSHATYDAAGRPNGAIETIRDVTERKRYEQALADSRALLERHRGVLMELAKAAEKVEDLDEYLEHLAETAARTLGVGRVGVWFFGSERRSMICRRLFDATSGKHETGDLMAVDRHPAYFAALDEERVITAHDAMVDPRTRDFASDYLKPHGITSLMDSPIRGGSTTIGVIGMEHVGSARRWTAEEESFAGSVADIVALAVESHRRREVERDLEHRLAMEDVITRTAARLLNESRERWDEVVNDTLGELGALADIDRCYLFEFFDEGRRFRNTHEWCGRGVSSHIEELQVLSTEDFAHVSERMKRGEVFHVARVADLPADAAVEKAEFEREGIQSILCVPVVRHGETVGLMGFDSVRREKAWTPDDIRLLKVVGELFAVTIRERLRG